MDNKNIFARNLRRQMEMAGKSRMDVCKALGFSYYTYSDWVLGKKYPRMDKVEMLAKYFGCLKSDLIEDKTASNDVGEKRQEFDIKSAVRALPKDVQEIVNLCLEIPGLAGDLKMIAQTIINRRNEK